MRLGAALRPLEGIEAANANLMGQVVLSWDDERIARDEIVALGRARVRARSLDPARNGGAAAVVHLV